MSWKDRGTGVSPVRGVAFALALFGATMAQAEDPPVDLDGKPLRMRHPSAGCYFADPVGLMLFVR